MSAVVIQFRSAFDPVRVELWLARPREGSTFYSVDYVERNEGRICMWSGADFSEAVEVATDCAEGAMPVVDLTDGGAA